MKLRLLVTFSVFLLARPALGQLPELKNPYPLKIGSTWTYRSGKQTIVKRVVAEEKLILEDKVKKGTPVEWKVMRLEFVNGGQTLTEHHQLLPEGVFRFKSAGKTINPPICILLIGKENSRWGFEINGEGDKTQGAFTAQDEMVTVPAGTYMARHVVGKGIEVGNEKMTVEYWFASDVGIVKQVTRVGSTETVQELLKYEP